MQQGGGHRSFSAVSDLRKCGEMYRLARVEGLPQRQSVAAMAGKVVHTATELVDHEVHDIQSSGVELLETKRADDVWRDGLIRAARAVATESLKQLLDEEDSSPSEWKVWGRQDLSWFESTGIPLAIQNYVIWRLGRTDLSLYVIPDFGPAIEVPFLLSLGAGDPVRGFIDRVFTRKADDGTQLNIVLDIKSGTKPKTTEQLGVYRRALMAVLPDKFDFGMYIYALKKPEMSETPMYDLTEWTEDNLRRIYNEADRLLSNNIFIPNPGETCNYCSVWRHCDYRHAAI